MVPALIRNRNIGSRSTSTAMRSADRFRCRAISLEPSAASRAAASASLKPAGITSCSATSCTGDPKFINQASSGAYSGALTSVKTTRQVVNSSTGASRRPSRSMLRLGPVELHTPKARILPLMFGRLPLNVLFALVPISNHFPTCCEANEGRYQ